MNTRIVSFAAQILGQHAGHVTADNNKINRSLSMRDLGGGAQLCVDPGRENVQYCLFIAIYFGQRSKNEGSSI